MQTGSHHTTYTWTSRSREDLPSRAVLTLLHLICTRL